MANRGLLRVRVALPGGHSIVSILFLQTANGAVRHLQQHSHAFLLGHVDIVQENMLRAQQRRHLRG